MGFFSEAATIYNHYQDSAGRDQWRRTVIPGVQWTHGKRQIRMVNGIATETIVEAVTIDMQRRYKGRKEYVDPVEYRKLPEDQAAEYWTLDPQGGMDYLAMGECGREIGKPSELRESCQYCGAVMSVADRRNRPRLKHIEVILE